MNLMFFIPLAGAIGMIFVGVFTWWVIKQEPGTPRMQEIASFIQEGANAFLRREFQTIAYFIAAIAVLLLIFLSWQIAFGFVMGAVFSLLAIFIGMNVATRANVRTSNAARTSPGRALTIAFRGGSVMGLSIVSLNMLGILLLMWLFGVGPDDPEGVSLLVGSSRPTSGPIRWARSRPESPRTIPATRRSSPTWWETTSVTAPAGALTSSSRARTM
jgi:Na+/H+-translocating membrane pyrophosphatase